MEGFEPPTSWSQTKNHLVTGFARNQVKTKLDYIPELLGLSKGTIASGVILNEITISNKEILT